MRGARSEEPSIEKRVESAKSAPFGLTLYGRRNGEPDSYYWRVTQWLFPWFTRIPPFGDHALGVVGDAMDALVGRRIAEASVHRFINDVARYLREELARS